MRIPNLGHGQKLIVSGLLGLLVLAAGVYVGKAMPDSLETVEVTNGNVRQTLKAVGIVSADQDIELRFSGLNVVSNVLVKPGDTVKKGQTLASLRAMSLAGVNMTAQASLEAARAQYESLKQGAKPEDLTVVQAQIDGTQAQIVRAKQKIAQLDQALSTQSTDLSASATEAQTHLAAEVASVDGVIANALSTAKISLSSMLSVFDRVDVQDSLTKSSSPDYSILRAQYDSAVAAIEAQSVGLHAATAEDALKNIAAVRSTIASASEVLSKGTSIIMNLTLTQYFTVTAQESAKTTIAGYQSQLQGAIGSLDAASKNITTAKASLESQGVMQLMSREASIQAKKDAEEDLKALEASMKIYQAQLKQKTAPPLAADLAQAAARVKQAEGEMARISGQYADTQLVAPVDGVIGRVLIEPGQFPPVTEPAMVMQGSSERSVLVYMSDEDTASIGSDATGFIEFESIPDRTFALYTDQIGSTKTKVGGIDSYRRLEFLSPHPELAVSTTGTVTIVIGEKQNVPVLPANVLETSVDGKVFVQVQSGDAVIRREIVTGLKGDDGTVEVVAGLALGEKVVVPSAK
jgi:multidrug resistance efflux pump